MALKIRKTGEAFYDMTDDTNTQKEIMTDDTNRQKKLGQMILKHKMNYDRWY